jgi:hypothetical protein
MLIEVGQLALSVVTLLLQRLDKRRDVVRQSSDLQMALLVLSESLGRWADAARETTETYVSPRQSIVSSEVSEWLSKEGSGDVASAQATLAAYAPELREQLGHVVATRTQQLDEITRFAGPHPWRLGSSDAKSLEASAAALKEAKRQLDKFIRKTFPRPPGSTG